MIYSLMSYNKEPVLEVLSNCILSSMQLKATRKKKKKGQINILEESHELRCITDHKKQVRL